MAYNFGGDILSGALENVFGTPYQPSNTNPQNNFGVFDTFATIAISKSIPTFWSDRPKLWFAQFEAITTTHRANEEHKVRLLVRSLRPQDLEFLGDLLSNPQTNGNYEVLKKRLIEIYEAPDSKEIEINFDNPLATYYPGDTVSGQVMVKLDSLEKVKTITVIVKGETNVKWTEEHQKPKPPSQQNDRRGFHNDILQDQEPTQNQVQNQNPDQNQEPEIEIIEFTSHEKYFERRLVLLKGAGTSFAVIQPGVNVYSFSTVLPTTLPSSFEGRFGHVRYTVKAILERPWKFDQGRKVAFTVVSPSDLNVHQKATIPIRLSEEKNVGCLCCVSGPLSVDLEAPFSGFVSGQYMPMSVNIENQTNQNIIYTKLNLKMVVSFTATGLHSKTRVMEHEIFTTNLGGMGAHSSNRYTQNILVPALPPSNLPHCSFIDLHYQLKLETDVTGAFCCGLGFDTIVFVGTVPIAGSINWAPNPVPYSNLPKTEKLGNSQDFEVVTVQSVPTAPPAPNHHGPFPNFPPLSYQESKFCEKVSVLDDSDNEHIQGTKNWTPLYPVYYFN